jgi:NifB/MoaA-like Fe-S oxidoreductase
LDFPQLENGVGLLALLKDEVITLLNETENQNDVSDEVMLPAIRRISIATGEAAFPLIEELIDEITKKWHNLKVNILKIRNTFFGDKITVAGLLTGKDLLEQLDGQVLGDELLIPSVSLRREGDLFLDNITLEQLSEKLKIPIISVPNSGRELIEAVLGR